MNRTFAKIWIAVFFVALACPACGPGKAEREQKQQEELAKEVIGIHDEVMPHMGELVKLRKRLKEHINGWAADSTGNSASIQEARKLVNDLDAADKAMMDWMHEYNGGQGLYEHEAIMEYLGNEKTKIQTVETDMERSMDAAKEFLGAADGQPAKESGAQK